APDAAFLHNAFEGIDGPAGAGLDHVDMRVEMHRAAARAAVEARDDIGARIAVAVARRAFAAHVHGLETGAPQPLAEIFGAGRVGLAGRVDRRKTDKVDGQRDKVFDTVFDRAGESFIHVGDETLPPGHLQAGNTAGQ